MSPGSPAHSRRGTRAVSSLLVGLAACWTIGQVTRDANRWVALCFYIPSPVPAALLLAASAVAVLRRAPGKAALWALLAAAPLFAVLGVENRFGAAAARPESVPADARRVSIVHWNVWEGTLGWDTVVTELLATDADLLVLSELPPTLAPETILRSFGEGFQGLVFESMAIISRDRIELRTAVPRDDEVIFASARWHSEIGPVDVLAVDLPSDLRFARDPVLRELTELLARTSPDLVVGDFNAPRRSRALQELPAGFRHAYEVAGRGWSYTWPLPVPVLAIDQCIVGPRVVPLSYELRSPWRSDHRLQRLEFTRSSDP